MKTLISLLPLFFAVTLIAQTNTFPTSGNVGIGTTSPSTRLEVRFSGTTSPISILGFDATTHTGGVATSYGGISLSNGVNSTVALRLLGGGVAQLATDAANRQLSFATGNFVEAMRIDGNGNVGIGTSTPGAKLHVQSGPTGYSWSPIAGSVGIFEGSVSNRAFLTIVGKSTGESELFFGDETVQNAGRVRYENNNDAMEFWTNSANRMMITNAGKVGIARTNPTGYLEVSTNLSKTSTSSANALSLTTNNSSGQFGLFANIKGASTLDARIVSLFTGDLNVASGGNLILQGSAGKVGIGTQSPDELLTVDGTIHSKEVKVDLNVPAPDYVFAKDYVLRDLMETKAYIEENSHLPEVPSADEFAKNGIEVGEMNMLLLRKIEELTLHLIELKKENQEMKQRLEKLENK